MAAGRGGLHGPERKGRFAGSEVVDAFTFTEPLGTGYPKTWLTGKRPITALHDGYEICGLDAHGTMVDAALVSLPDKLTGLVEAQGRNHGAFSLPVARVTVQTKDGPELDAVVHNGFWFAPIKAGPMPFLSPKEAQGGGISPDSVVGVYPGVRLRGYSATGRLLYDSERDAYTFGDCYPVRGSACTQIPWQRADPSR